MRFTLVNLSTDPEITPGELQFAASRLERQLKECVCPLWEEDANTKSVATADTLADVPSDSIPVVLFDDADTANALGYHTTTPDGRPFSKVFVRTIRAAGGAWRTGADAITSVLSHEIIETEIDPYVTSWSMNDGDRKLYATEAGDPVESDWYEIDGVSVSNFVGPRWFSQGPGPYDWLGTVSRPFTMSPGGYVILMDPATGAVTQQFGDAYPAWRKEMKKHPAARTFKRAGAP